jgi:hypothetical protein
MDSLGTEVSVAKLVTEVFTRLEVRGFHTPNRSNCIADLHDICNVVREEAA